MLRQKGGPREGADLERVAERVMSTSSQLPGSQWRGHISTDAVERGSLGWGPWEKKGSEDGGGGVGRKQWTAFSVHSLFCLFEAGLKLTVW